MQKKYAIIPMRKVKANTRLIADGGFNCIKEGARLTVMESKSRLYVKCSSGEHYLDGQCDGKGNFVGFWLEKEKQ